MSAFPWFGRGWRFRPLSHRLVHRDMRPAIDVINAVFAETPDIPMQRACHVVRRRDGGMDIAWRHIGEAQILRWTSGLPGDVDEGFARQAADARAHVAEQRIRRFLLAEGWRPGEPEPVWCRLVAVPHATLLDVIGLDLSDIDSASMCRRIGKIAEQRGERARFEDDRRILIGRVAMRNPSCWTVSTAAGVTITVLAELPATMLNGFAGRPIDEVAMIGDGMRDTIITSARQNGGELELTVSTPMTTLVVPPGGFDPTWIAQAREHKG